MSSTLLSVTTGWASGLMRGVAPSARSSLGMVSWRDEPCASKIISVIPCASSSLSEWGWPRIGALRACGSLELELELGMVGISSARSPSAVPIHDAGVCAVEVYAHRVPTRIAARQDY